MLQAERGSRLCHIPKYSVFGPRQPFGRIVIHVPLSSIGVRLGYTAQRAVCPRRAARCLLRLGVPEETSGSKLHRLLFEQFVQNELQWSLEDMDDTSSKRLPRTTETKYLGM